MNTENRFSFEYILTNAKKIARKHEVNFIGTEHLLLAMLLYDEQFFHWLDQKCTSKETISALRRVLEELIDLNHMCGYNKSDQQCVCEVNHNHHGLF